MEEAILLYTLSKKKKFLDKKLKENLKTLHGESSISNESPNSISTNRREEASERLGIHESNALDVKTISG